MDSSNKKGGINNNGKKSHMDVNQLSDDVIPDTGIMQNDGADYTHNTNYTNDTNYTNYTNCGKAHIRRGLFIYR